MPLTFCKKAGQMVSATALIRTSASLKGATAKPLARRMAQDNSKAPRRLVDRNLSRSPDQAHHRRLVLSPVRSRRLNSRRRHRQVQARNSRRPVPVRGHSKARSKVHNQVRVQVHNPDGSKVHNRGHNPVRVRGDRSSSSTPSIRSRYLPNRITA